MANQKYRIPAITIYIIGSDLVVLTYSNTNKEDPVE